MADGGQHFAGKEVDEYCERNAIKHQTTPAYAPWVNGLVEGANKILLGRLKRLCCPDLNQAEAAAVDPESIPKKWPDFLEQAIAQMNDRILPSIGYSPREILLGMAIQRESNGEAGTGGNRPQENDFRVHMAFVHTLNEDITAKWDDHCEKRKLRFDAGVNEVTFEPGQLVQVYDSKLDTTMETKKKIIPRWSAPVRIVEREVNSYRVETIHGVLLRGRVHARRLRRFILGRGSDHARQELERKKVSETEKRRIEVEMSEE